MMSDCIALDFLLNSHGDVCAVANIFCCTWINGTGKVEQGIYYLEEKTIWLSVFDPMAYGICFLGLG